MLLLNQTQAFPRKLIFCNFITFRFFRCYELPWTHCQLTLKLKVTDSRQGCRRKRAANPSTLGSKNLSSSSISIILTHTHQFWRLLTWYLVNNKRYEGEHRKRKDRRTCWASGFTLYKAQQYDTAASRRYSGRLPLWATRNTIEIKTPLLPTRMHMLSVRINVM